MRCSERPVLTYTNFLYVQLITDFIKDIITEKTDIIVSGESASFVIMACANDDTVINRVIIVNPQDLASQAKIPTKRSYMVKYLLLGTGHRDLYLQHKGKQANDRELLLSVSMTTILSVRKISLHALNLLIKIRLIQSTCLHVKNRVLLTLISSVV